MMVGWPYVSPPTAPKLSMLPAYIPPLPPEFVTTRLSCVACGQRVDPDVEDVAEFLKWHGVHIRLFMESVNTGKRFVWRASR